MDNQNNQSTPPAAGSTDPMGMPAMPSASTSGADMSGGMTPPADPMAAMATPPASSMDAMAAGSSMPAAAPVMDTAMLVAPMPSPAMSGPATMDDVMAELKKIEDKLVEMDEKL